MANLERNDANMANPHNFSTKLFQEPKVEANNSSTFTVGNSREEPPNMINKTQLLDWSQEERDVFSEFLLAQWKVEEDLEWNDRSRVKELFATVCNILQALFPEPTKFTFSACNKQWKQYLRDLPEFQGTFDFSPRPESPEPAVGFRLTGDQGGTREGKQEKSEKIKVMPDHVPMSSIGTPNSTLLSQPTKSSKILGFNNEQTATLKNVAGLAFADCPSLGTRVRLAKDIDVPQKKVNTWSQNTHQRPSGHKEKTMADGNFVEGNKRNDTEPDIGLGTHIPFPKRLNQTSATSSTSFEDSTWLSADLDGKASLIASPFSADSAGPSSASTQQVSSYISDPAPATSRNLTSHPRKIVKRKRYAKETVKILKEEGDKNGYYPNRETLERLANETGENLKRVRNWFANARTGPMAHRYQKTEETIHIKEEVNDLACRMNATEENNHKDYEHMSYEGFHQMHLTNQISSSTTNQHVLAVANSILPARVPEQEASFTANSSSRHEGNFINPYSELEKIKTHIEDFSVKIKTAAVSMRDSNQGIVALQKALEPLKNQRIEAEMHFVEYQEELKKWQKKETAFRNLLDVMEE